MAGTSNVSKQIFISYSRVDVDFARAMYAELAALGFTLWRDRAEIEGGENWWLQIEEAIRGVETMVLCLSEKALESPVVRKEWRIARQEGTRVIPVIASDVDFKKLPQWMTDVHWYDFRQKASNPEHQLQWDRFVAQLKTPYEPKRVPFMVENLPEGFVPRPDVLEPMVAALLDDERENPKAITTAIRGAGGYGKTTMARAICHDEGIQQAFDDGILWVTLGETPDLITLVLDLVFALRGERPPVTGLDAAQAELTKALADRDILLVIDDCWQLEHIKPFVQGGNRCARLITTRRRETLPENTQAPYELAEMKTAEATALLGFGLPNMMDQREALIALAKRLYEYPLLLRLVNGTLRDLMGFGQGLAAAIRDVNEALDQQAGDDWDSAVTRTLNVSLKQLDSDSNARERFNQLAVFPEDIDIPLATIGKLWGTGALVTKNACMRFAKLSLLLDLNLERGTIRLHDVIRAYLRKGVNLAALDRKLLDAYQITEWYTLPPDEPYLWDWLFAHLWGAGRTEELIRTALDLRYLANKTAARSTYAVESDLVIASEIAPEDATLRLLTRQYVNMAPIWSRCKDVREVREALHERLKYSELLQFVCSKLYGQLTTPRLESWRELPDLPHPALIRVLEGNEIAVEIATFSKDGQFILTLSTTGVRRVWETQTGKLLRTLNEVTEFGDLTQKLPGVGYSPDGKYIVAADGNSAHVREAITNRLLFVLAGHKQDVHNVAFSADGKYILTGSWDKVARIWDAITGKLKLELYGHEDLVHSVEFSPDGQRILTSSYDNTARVWDAATGKLLLRLTGHERELNSAHYSPDGYYIVTASWDETARVWDARAEYTSHESQGAITTLDFSPDGKYMVTTTNDANLTPQTEALKTIQVWDFETGKLVRSLPGHSSAVTHAYFSPYGEKILSFTDTAGYIWDMDTGKLLFTENIVSGIISEVVSEANGQQVHSTQEIQALRMMVLRAYEKRSLTNNSNGRFRVTVSGSQSIVLYDILTRKHVQTLYTDGLVSCIGWHPDGKHIVAGGTKGLYWLRLVE